MSSGKFTLKGLMKSKSQLNDAAQKIIENITQLEKDIENYEKMKNFLIVYLAQIAIPNFKKQKVHNYINAMTNFSLEEISNSHKNSDQWSDFLESIKKVQK